MKRIAKYEREHLDGKGEMIHKETVTFDYCLVGYDYEKYEAIVESSAIAWNTPYNSHDAITLSSKERERWEIKKELRKVVEVVREELQELGIEALEVTREHDSVCGCCQELRIYGRAKPSPFCEVKPVLELSIADREMNINDVAAIFRK